jgi:hypothetical protein
VSDWDWKCHVETDWATNQDRVIIHRRIYDDVAIVTGVDDNGVAVVTTFEPGIAPTTAGITLPEGAAQAIAEAVKPGPSTAELSVLREWLAAERDRTERIIDQTLEQLRGES